MFDTLKKITGAVIFGTAFMGAAYMPAYALESDRFTVHLQNVQASSGSLYVSVQKREDFMQERASAGGVYKNVNSGDLSYTYPDIEPGEYSVMIWHDIDGDGEFSMGENHMPLDGWGASGSDLQGQPTFDDVKITIDARANELSIAMQYPQK